MARALVALLAALALAQGAYGACIYTSDALQSAIDGAKLGDVLTLCNSTVLQTTLKISRPVTINGTCGTLGITPCTLSGTADTDRLVYVPENVGIVYLKNLVLSNSLYAGNYGPALESDTGSVVDLANVTFQNNNGVYGGAMYAYGNATLTSCNFNNNSATSDGGALYLQGSLAIIRQCTFTNNKAAGAGGAISIYSTLRTVVIAGSTFTNNTASDVGGAVDVDTNVAAQISLIGNTFTGNSAAKGAGALFLSGSPLLSGNSFSQNTGSRGGAVIVSGGQVANFCGANNYTGNTALTGQGPTLIVENNQATDGVANFCGGLPAGTFTATNGNTNTTCSSCSCSANPCDSNAACSVSPSQGATCACKTGYSGNGFLCLPAGTGGGSTPAGGAVPVPSATPVASPTAPTPAASSNKTSAATSLVPTLALGLVSVVALLA